MTDETSPADRRQRLTDFESMADLLAGLEGAERALLDGYAPDGSRATIHVYVQRDTTPKLVDGTPHWSLDANVSSLGKRIRDVLDQLHKQGDTRTVGEIVNQPRHLGDGYYSRWFYEIRVDHPKDSIPPKP